MNLRAVIKNAYQALRQNTRRSILTMLGIVIGIASVITILSLGRGFETYTVKNLTATNEKNVAVDVVFSPSDYEQFESNKMRYFSDEDLKFIGQIEGVEKVAYVKSDDNFLRIDLQTADKKISKNLGFVAGGKDAVEVGRTISRDDIETHQKVAIISRDTAKDVNPDVNKVLGTGIDIKGELYQIVGIYKGGTANLFDMTPDVKIPKTTYQYYANSEGNPTQIKVTIANDYKPSKVAQKVIKKLEKVGISRHFGEYSTFDMRSLTDGIGKVLKMLTFFIS